MLTENSAQAGAKIALCLCENKNELGRGGEMMTRNAILVGMVLVALTNIAIGQHSGPPPIPGAGIAGTRHDARTWYRSVQACNICHAPHNTSGQLPLWNHAMSAATYTLYGSGSMKATAGQPGSTSKLCLSCHDGTVAINDFAGRTGSATATIGPSNRNQIGTNLGNDHPIGMTYDATQASSGKFEDPATKNVTIGSTVSKSGTIAAMMLYGGKVECPSCHDVHNVYTVGSNHFLVKVDVAGSSLCLQCHLK